MSLFEGIRPDGKPDAVRLDANSNLAISGPSMDSIAANTQIANGWFPYQSKRYTSVGSGIDLTTAVPNRKAIAIMGSRTTTNGSVLQVEFMGNAPGELIDLNFGPGFAHYGQWKKIDAASSAGCFPLFVLFV